MGSAFDNTYTSIDPRTPGYEPEAGLGETISAQFAFFNSEYLGRSEADAWVDNLKERRLLIEGITGEKVDTLTPMIQDLMGPDPSLGFPMYSEPRGEFKLANGQTIAQFAAENPEVLSDDEIWEKIVVDANAVRDRAVDVMRRSSGLTNITGSLIGGFAAALRDPAILISMAYGAGTAFGVLKTAAIEAGIAGVAESFIQPNVISFQKKLGREVTATDAIRNIAFVSVAAGAFGGALKGVALMAPVRRWKHPQTKATDELLERMAGREMGQEEQLAFRFLNEHSEIMSRNPFDITDPNSLRLHSNAIGTTFEALDNYVTPDYSRMAFGRDLATDGINPDMKASAATRTAFDEFKEQFRFTTKGFDNPLRDAELAVTGGDPVLREHANLAFREAQKLDIDIPTLVAEGDDFIVRGSRKSKEVLREVLEDEKAAARLVACQIGG